MVEKVQIFGHVKSDTYYGKKFYFVFCLIFKTKAFYYYHKLI